MNKTFTKSKKIELDSNWHLTPDGDNGVILTFHEVRERKKKNSEEMEDFLFEDKRYFTRIVQALRLYAEKTLNTSSTLQEIIEKEDRIMNLLEKMDKEFKQFK